MKEEKKERYKTFLPLLLAIVLIIGMLLGFNLRDATNSKKPLFDKHGINTIDEVLSYIQAKYVDTVNTENLSESAIL